MAQDAVCSPFGEWPPFEPKHAASSICAALSHPLRGAHARCFLPEAAIEEAQSKRHQLIRFFLVSEKHDFLLFANSY
jgi:hypothetical protein